MKGIMSEWPGVPFLVIAVVADFLLIFKNWPNYQNLKL